MVLVSLNKKGNYVTGEVSQTGRKSHSRSTEATTEKRGKMRREKNLLTALGTKQELRLCNSLSFESVKMF